MRKSANSKYSTRITYGSISEVFIRDLFIQVERSYWWLIFQHWSGSWMEVAWTWTSLSIRRWLTTGKQWSRFVARLECDTRSLTTSSWRPLQVRLSNISITPMASTFPVHASYPWNPALICCSSRAIYTHCKMAACIWARVGCSAASRSSSWVTTSKRSEHPWSWNRCFANGRDAWSDNWFPATI